MPFSFVANLKPYTFHRGRGVRRFDAYLLSVDFSSRKAAALARRVIAEGKRLCADNGNVDAIRELLRRFEDRARTLDAARKAEEEALGRYARPGELSSELTEAYRELAATIRTASAEVTHDEFVRAAVEGQRAMNASYAIGMEDLTIASMTGLSLEPEYCDLPSDFFTDLNVRAATLAVQTSAGRFGPPPVHVFAGVHAMNFDQAVEAGRVAGQLGLSGVATGLVGALRDRNSVDFRVQRGALVDLGLTVARPYLRVVEIAAGLHAGFHEASGRRPAFHALGAGTPILLPLLGLLSAEGVYTATDSTSPIVDGWSGPTISLYVDDPAPLKLRADKIAQSWLEGGRGWDCDCSYCRRFNELHPPRLRSASRWWVKAGRPRISKRDLLRTGPLAPLLPLLAHHPQAQVRRAAGLARVGHNHTIVQRIERTVRRSVAQGRPDVIDAMIEAYVAYPGAQRWRASAAEAQRLAKTVAASLGRANTSVAVSDESVQRSAAS